MRQRGILQAGAAVLLGLSIVADMAEAAPADAAAHFAPPEAPLVLTRTVWRSLRDGQQIMVRRRYAVQFVPVSGGYVMTGRQIDAVVDAPPPLAPLAEIERGRTDDSPFPLQIDPAGRITASGRPARDDPADAAAVAQARKLLRESDLPVDAKRTAEHQAEQIAATAAQSGQWPADLFSPASRDWTNRHSLALPGGKSGEVKVAMRYVRAADGKVPSTVERTVTTVLDGTTRVSREVWTITAS